MKRKLFILFSLFYFSIAFGQYSIKMRIDQIDTQHPPDEWKCHVWVDIFDSNNDLINPPPTTTYNWEQDKCDGAGYHWVSSSSINLIDGQIAWNYTPSAMKILNIRHIFLRLGSG